MSVVTGVTIVSQACDEDFEGVGLLVQKLNDWIKIDPPCGGGTFKRVDDYAGGGKHPENHIWCGGFNYLSWAKFIDYAQSLPWGEALGGMADEQRVIMIVSPDQRQAQVVYLA